MKAGFVSVGVFASLMGITTVLHWAKFHHDRGAFWLWVLLYATTPFLLVGYGWVTADTMPRPPLTSCCCRSWRPG